jgi:hypothetical protein
MVVAWVVVWRQQQGEAALTAPPGWDPVLLGYGQPHPDEAEGWYCRTAADYRQFCLVRREGTAGTPAADQSADSNQQGGFALTMVAVTALGTLLSGIGAMAALRRRERQAGQASE